MTGKGTIALAVGTILGIVLIGVGIGMIYEFKNIIHDRIVEELPLTNGSESFTNWMDPPVPVYMQFYVFDVRNVKEVLNEGEKPAVVEMGPYTYRELRGKIDVVFDSDGAEILYREPKSYVFVPELSNGLENDTFTTVNLPILTIAREYEHSLLHELVKAALDAFDAKLFDEYTVAGFLWGQEIDIIANINKFIHLNLFDVKWGLFYGPTGNGTNDGVYRISTGTKDVKTINQIYSWNNNDTLPYWGTSYCNQINGTDGTMWHPFIEKTDRLYLFSSDICRAIYVEFDHVHTVKGIPLYHFAPPPEVFADHETNPDNACFCTPDCLGSGVLNVSNCRNAPVIVSQPHFFQGAAEYIDAIVGMNPSKDKHQTYIEVEPYTGVAMNASKKIQINAYIQPLGIFSDTTKMNRTIFPVIWLNETGVIDNDSASKFHNEVQRPVRLLTGVQWAMIAVGILVCVICAVIIIMFIIKSRQKDGLLLVQSEDDDYNPSS